LVEIKFDGGFSAEDNYFYFYFSFLVEDLEDSSFEAGERTHNNEDGVAFGIGGVDSSDFGSLGDSAEDSIDLAFLEGGGVVLPSDEGDGSGDVGHNVDDFLFSFFMFADGGVHEDISGEEVSDFGFLLSVADFEDGFHRDDDFADAVSESESFNFGIDGFFDSLFVAGEGFDAVSFEVGFGDTHGVWCVVGSGYSDGWDSGIVE